MGRHRMILIVGALLLAGLISGNDCLGADSPDPKAAAISLLRQGNVEAALQTLGPLKLWEVPLKVKEPASWSGLGGVLHHVLMKLSPDERYEQLRRWSVAEDQIRGVITPVSLEAPPPEFARALGERPRRGVFDVASIGPIRGVMSTRWMLVESAKEAGRLNRLIAEVTPLAEKKVPGAESLLLLMRLVDDRTDLKELDAAVSAWAQRIRGEFAGKKEGLESISPVDLEVAIVAAQHSQLSARSAVVEALIEGTLPQSSPYLRPLLHVSLAVSYLRKAAATLEPDGAEKIDFAKALAPRLKFWEAGSAGNVAAESVWLTHEDQLLALSNSPNDALWLRFPIEGNFRFDLETQIGQGYRGPADGGVIYDGLRMQPFVDVVQIIGNDLEPTLAVQPVLRTQRPGWLTEFHLPPNFSPIAVTGSNETTSLEINRHPIYREPSGSRASPWLGIRSLPGHRPIFRNFQLTGSPTIPRSVSLLGEHAARSWFARRAEKWPRSSWKIQGGLLTSPAGAPAFENHVAYERPLFSGESISCEFMASAESSEIHPAFGRLVFLIQSDGVRIRWLTDGASEGTLLATDNTVLEPLNRRGPKQPPLKPGEWNRLSLSRNERNLTLSLNDVEIYQRPIDWTGDERFGLYRSDVKHDVQVRGIVMTGDWPEAVPPEFLANPMVQSGETPRHAERLARQWLFGEDYLASNVRRIRKDARSLDLEARFQFLSNWVLPSQDHGFRLTCDFTPSYPAPPALEPGYDTTGLGGEIVAPVIDWLDCARELKRLEECRQRVTAYPIQQEELQERSRLALILLLAIAKGDSADHAVEWDSFFTMTEKIIPVRFADLWPETAVMAFGMRQSPDDPFLRELVSRMLWQRAYKWRPYGLSVWDNHVASMSSRLESLRPASKDDAGASESRANNPPSPPTKWLPTISPVPAYRGRGYPPAQWDHRGDLVTRRSHHGRDFLLYRLPLAGDLQVECDLSHGPSEAAQIMIRGLVSGPQHGLKLLYLKDFRDTTKTIPVDPPVLSLNKPLRFRGVVQDDQLTVFINGRPVHTQTLEDRDPWIGLRCYERIQSQVSDIRITGNPTVLETVPMISSKVLGGWVPCLDTTDWSILEVVSKRGQTLSVPGETKGSDPVLKPPLDEDTLILDGKPQSDLEGFSIESHIRYLRPLVEDGTIRYEFFYEPGKFIVHPAIDKLALILDPDQISEHWITDLRYDRSDLRPDNRSQHPDRRRGPKKLPLRTGEWNQAALHFQGQRLRIELNDELVYERELESTNSRHIGFFRDLGKTGARVRNATMTGNWPRQLSPVDKQELVDPRVVSLDADRPKLKGVFRYNFVSDPSSETASQKTLLPGSVKTGDSDDDNSSAKNFFKWPNDAPWPHTPKGIAIRHRATGTWVGSEITARFALSGDFESEVEFGDFLATSAMHDSAILLRLWDHDPWQHIFDISRIITKDQRNLSQAAKSTKLKTEGSSWTGNPTPTDAISGRFRFARRGDKLHYLLAEGDSPNFHWLHTEPITREDLPPNSLRLHTACTSGSLDAYWRNWTIRAERLSWQRPAGPSVLNIYDDQGRLVTAIPTPKEFAPHIMGSPEWSPDGKLIAVDIWRGNGSNSSIVVLNADGTNFRTVATGGMPSFSADGKRLVFSGPQGIMTVKIDGTDQQVIDSGWGAQWSPDGKWVAYRGTQGLSLWNPATKKSKTLFPAQEVYAHWNLGWSHDSQAIAFKGRVRGNNQASLCVAELGDPPQLKILRQNLGDLLNEDCTFTFDNRDVIAGYSPSTGATRVLHRFNRKNPEQASRFDVIPNNFNTISGSWSRDGKRFAAVGHDAPTLVPWTEEMSQAHAN